MRTPILNFTKIAQLTKKLLAKGRWYEAENAATAPYQRPDIKWFEWTSNINANPSQGTPFKSTKSTNFVSYTQFLDHFNADVNSESQKDSSIG